MVNRFKKHKWYVIRYNEGELIPYNVEDKLKAEFAARGGIGEIPKDLLDNAIRFLPEQVNARAAYDWNARVDVNSGVVQIPLVEMTEVPDGKVLELSKQGLSVIEDSGEGMSKQSLREYVKMKVAQWSDICLLYSAGGLIDAMSTRKQMSDKKRK